jgi:hypothetical protein
MPRHGNEGDLGLKPRASTETDTGMSGTDKMRACAAAAMCLAVAAACWATKSGSPCRAPILAAPAFFD